MQLTGQRVLAFGTAGTQGSGLVPALLEHGAVPVRATHRPERAQQWRESGEEAVVADLADTAAVLAAAQEAGVTAVAGHIPLSMGPAGRDAVGTVLALRGTGLPTVVNIGGPVPAPGVPDPYGYGPTAQALVAGGVTTLTPTAYLDNLAAPWSLARLAGGEFVYPRPAGDDIAWVAARDLGAAAAGALAHDAGAEHLALAGPQVLTFNALAGEVAAGLEREVRFVEVTPAEFADALRPFLGDQAAAGVQAAYGSMPPRSPDWFRPDAAGTWQRVGVEATSARDWASQVLRPALDGFTAPGRGEATPDLVPSA